jgi:hypothetical protein
VKYVGIGTGSIFSNAAGAIYARARIAEEIVFDKSRGKGAPLLKSVSRGISPW